MKIMYEDAFGLWLKIQQVGLHQQTMSPVDSVLVTWASIVLAPVYLLAQAFEGQSLEKFQEGVKTIEVDLALTEDQLRQLDRIFVNTCLRTQPTLETNRESMGQNQSSVEADVSTGLKTDLKTDANNLEGENVSTTPYPLDDTDGEVDNYETQENKDKDFGHKEHKWKPPTSYYN